MRSQHLAHTLQPETDYVTLGQLLKVTGIAASGGGAKLLLANEIVLVNGEREQRRGRKLRAGDTVTAPGAVPIVIVREAANAPQSDTLPSKAND